MRRLILFVAACVGLAGPGLAQPAWPTRPVTIVVPYIAGGPSDTLARAVGAALTPAIGQPVVVENRPGANGAVAAGQAARAAPDGHTLLVAASGIMTINPHVMRNLAYDPLRDFAPLTIAISAPNLLVAHPSLAPETLPALVAWLRAHPGKASYGSSGIGSSEHLSMELFAQRTGTALTHVPYGGSAAAVTDLLAGTVQVAFLNIAAVAPPVRAGGLRAIAVGSPARHPLLPEVPTVAEEVPGFAGGSWHSFAVPRATPEPLQERLHAALVAALRTPEVGERLARTGFTVEGTGRADAAARIAREFAEWREVVRTAGLGAN